MRLDFESFDLFAGAGSTDLERLVMSFYPNYQLSKVHYQDTGSPRLVRIHLLSTIPGIVCFEIVLKTGYGFPDIVRFLPNPPKF